MSPMFKNGTPHPTGIGATVKVPKMTDAAQPRPTRFRTGGLSPRKPTRFSFMPDAEARAGLATELGLLGLHKLEMTGEVRPNGRDELLLEARLVARVDQPCSVTLVPVPASVDEPVRRRYVADFQFPEGDEVEMPEDDTVEPMPEMIDLAEIAAEVLALALPLYPRAPGVDFDQILHAGDGVAPLSDQDVKPFSALQGLAEQLKAKGKSGSESDG
jgi:uncharacterized metal-binding protein YceD (DUF177 family)